LRQRKRKLGRMEFEFKDRQILLNLFNA
jgi:hypothetical protein